MRHKNANFPLAYSRVVKFTRFPKKEQERKAQLIIILISFYPILYHLSF